MDSGLDRGGNPSLGLAQRLLAGAGTVVVLTGAGISTDSGIPDFRGPNGVWTKNPEAEKLATLSAYLADPEIRRRAWRSRLDSPTWTARPNVSHLALARLAGSGKLHTLVTQNIDGLHQAAGTDPDLIVELHGTMHQVMCMSCDRRSPMAETLDRVRAGEEDPPCRECGGILKSATISFGQDLVVEDLRRATRAATECDLMLAIGSSLGVFPAAGLVPIARENHAALVIVNAEETGFDSIADAVVRVPIGEAVPALVG
ncbi:MAG TPA: Sir2 family NAD-dependent protein deacetylase [Acidimicrobiales bacterium]|nr:Sir2 family NAD-dependent protein deacetylase [Acidimicrobiales bacterium]